MKKYPNLGWFLLGINLGTVFTLLTTMYLIKTEAKPKYKSKKEYKFEEPKDWNNENLTREQHQVYQTLIYERAE